MAAAMCSRSTATAAVSSRGGSVSRHDGRWRGEPARGRLGRGHAPRRLPPGLDLSDAVRRTNDPAGRDDPALPYHRRWVWDGRRFDGRHVLVRCYHGFGDTLQFLRYLPALRHRAASVTVEIQPELLPLAAGMADVDRFVAFDPAHPLPPAECDLEIMELAAALRIEPWALPAALFARRAHAGAGAARRLVLAGRAGGTRSGRCRPPCSPLWPTGRVVDRCAPAPPPLPVRNPGGMPGDDRRNRRPGRVTAAGDHGGHHGRPFGRRPWRPDLAAAEAPGGLALDGGAQ